MSMFRPAIREHVPLLIGMAGGSGSGKTFSGMRVAKGIGDGKRFAVIDTEARRASHYADLFEFDVVNFTPPFTPKKFLEYARAAEKAGYPAILIDSFSHEWMGEGGVLSMQEAEVERMSRGDAGRADSVKLAAWIKPKTAHREMLDGLLQIRTPMIFCMRGKSSPMMVVDPDTGKKKVVDGPFKATTSDDVPYEMTALFVLSPTKPGTVDFGQPNKISAPLRPLIKDGIVLDEAFGAAAAAWAVGKPLVELVIHGDDNKTRAASSIDVWVDAWQRGIADRQKKKNRASLVKLLEVNRDTFEKIRVEHPEQVAEIEELIATVLAAMPEAGGQAA